MRSRPIFPGTWPGIIGMALLILSLIALSGCMKLKDESFIPSEFHPRFKAIESNITAPLDTELRSFGSITEINRYVNQTVSYVSEPAGRDIWQEPNLTLDIRSGDCEDYAVLKMALITQRFPGNRPQVLLVTVRATGQTHAMLVIQDSVALDNKFDYGLDINGCTFKQLYKPIFFVRSSL